MRQGRPVGGGCYRPVRRSRPNPSIVQNHARWFFFLFFSPSEKTLQVGVQKMPVFFSGRWWFPGLFELHCINLGVVQFELQLDNFPRNGRGVRLLLPRNSVFNIVDPDGITIIQREAIHSLTVFVQ
jgi:hypothetical protein